MPPFFIRPVFEDRAEIKKQFRSFFGSNENNKIGFWNLLTFRVSVILCSINYRFSKLFIQFLGGFKWNLFTNLSWKRRFIKNKNEIKERKSSHCTLGNQDNVRQVSLEYTSVSCLLHNRYRYHYYFFLQSYTYQVL